MILHPAALFMSSMMISHLTVVQVETSRRPSIGGSEHTSIFGVVLARRRSGALSGCHDNPPANVQNNVEIRAAKNSMVAVR